MKALRIVGLIVFVGVACLICYLLGFGHGSFNQARWEQQRWEQVRAEILDPPEFGTRPPRRVIPELGIRVYWMNWNNGPVRSVTLEDLR